MNIIERYLAESAGLDSVWPGQDIICRVSMAAAHDVTAPIAIEMFRRIGAKKVFDPRRIVLVVDHVFPAATVAARANAWAMKDFAKEFGVLLYEHGEGVIHQLLYERHRQQPGSIVVTADSHAGTCGGYGAIGIGVGSTEMAAVMATGTIDLTVPETVQVHLSGGLAENACGKDLILYLGGLLGDDHLTDKALVFTGEGINSISIEERMTICNMGIELGAMITLFASEAIETDTAETIELNLEELVPYIAVPFCPVNGVPAAVVEGTPITQVVIGSCTNGRLSDMEQAVRILSGKRISPDVNVFVIPASKAILNEMEKRGWCHILLVAGATVLNPGCGSCFGAHQGLAASRDVVLSTTNRNFPGRMGSKEAKVYLASPATAAASALTGKITVLQVK